jgi:hypothetical protein
MDFSSLGVGCGQFCSSVKRQPARSSESGVRCRPRMLWRCAVDRVGSDRLQDPDAVGDGAPGDVGVEGDGVELVRGAGVDVELNRDTGAAELRRVGGVLVAEDVDLADLDVGGRQAGRVLEPGWGGRGGYVGSAGRVAEQRRPRGGAVVIGPKDV